MLARCRVVDGQVAGGIGAGGKHYGIQSERRTYEHAHDVECGSDEGELLLSYVWRQVLAFAHGVDHHRKAAEYHHGNEESDDMLFLVVEHPGADVDRCHQSHDGQDQLQRPCPLCREASAAVHVALRFHGNV